MALLSFDKFKLFKGAEIQPARTPEEPEDAAVRLPPLQRFLGSPVSFLVVVVIVVGLFLSYRPARSLTAIARGEIAPADVIAPVDLTYEDPAATARKRAEAENAVLPVYSFEPNVFANTEDKIRGMFGAGRDWSQKNSNGQNANGLRAVFLDRLGIDLEPDDVLSLIKLRFPAELEETLVRVCGKLFNQGIILSKSLFIQGEQDRGLTLLGLEGAERNVKVGEILDLREAEERFAAEVEKMEFPARSRALLRNLAQIFLTPNITYNKIETERRRASARAGVAPVAFTVKKGRVIIRKGDEAGDDAVRVLELFNQRLRRRSSWIPDFAGSILLYALLFLALLFYFQSAFKKDAAEKNFRMTGTFLVASLTLYKIFMALALTISASVKVDSFARAETYYYAFPFQVGTLILAFLASDQVALTYTILNSLTVGYLLGADFYVMIFTFLGGLAAIYGVKSFRRRYRAATLRAGFLFVPPVNAFVILTYHMIEKKGSLVLFSSEVFMGLLGGVAGAVLAYLFLPLVESSFGFVTASKLLELTNSDLPVFRQMSEEAPGSYHHSLVVATLAEKAAEELGLDTQLVKAGALYHDIGKTKMPEYFIENQSKEFDLHRDLKPSMSTLVITNHVKEGVEMARKLKLPRPLREIIEQHHGNSLVRFFYIKAKQTTDPEVQKIGEESYRYPGPSPQTREAALVMLADSVEAASRSLKSPTKDNLKRVITDIFNTYLQDGQLDDCDFSLRELRAVAGSFLTILYAIYHPRVEYPGFKFEGRRREKPAPAKKTNHDRNHQPPEKTKGPDEDV